MRPGSFCSKAAPTPIPPRLCRGLPEPGAVFPRLQTALRRTARTTHQGKARPNSGCRRQNLRLKKTLIMSAALPKLSASFAALLLAGALSAAPLSIEKQGSFAAGGTVVPAKTAYDPYHPTADRQDLRGDHAFVRYRIPTDARTYPLAFLHGHVEFSKTWETTPDGRDGFRTSSSPAASRSTSSPSRAAEAPGRQR